MSARDRVGVDAVLDNRRGQVIGVKVKVSSTVRTKDLAMRAQHQTVSINRYRR